jgi:hypothetical protein
MFVFDAYGVEVAATGAPPPQQQTWATIGTVAQKVARKAQNAWAFRRFTRKLNMVPST